VTDRQTDRRTDGQTDGRTDGRHLILITQPLLKYGRLKIKFSDHDCGRPCVDSMMVVLKFELEFRKISDI